MKKEKTGTQAAGKYTISSRGIEVAADVAGARCPYCKDPVMKGSSCYKFAHVDAKTVRIRHFYAHLSCSLKHVTIVRGSEADTYLPDEKVLGFWRGMKALEIRRHQ